MYITFKFGEIVLNNHLSDYPNVVNLINTIDEQMSENLIARMDTEFDKTLSEPDHKIRAKMVKAHHRNVKEVSPVSEAISPMQIRMTQIKTNLTFVLECARYNLSYKAVARYFAEYDFLCQNIKKEVKKAANNEVVKDYIDRTSILEENFFQVLMDTIPTLEHNVIHKMAFEPETYIDLDIHQDSEVVFDDIKEAYKNHIKKLKEDMKKSAA